MSPTPHLTEEVLDELRSRPWAGNVRELRNAIEHAAIVARGRTIRPEHLPPASSGPGGDRRESRGRYRAAPRRVGPARSGAARCRPGEAALYERFLELTEPHVLRAALGACLNNRAQAAQVLGIHRATLRQKLNKYGIS